jgi:hypothetical protein
LEGTSDTPAGRPGGNVAAAIDGAWYCSRYPDVAHAGMDPIAHYLEAGWREGRWPNPVFDPDHYRAQAPETVEEPLGHYLAIGEELGRRPIAWFDPRWYRAAHGLPDGMSSLAHYLVHRMDGSVSPNADFDVRFYRERYADIAVADIDPYEHFMLAGRAEGRLPRREGEILRGSGLVDPNYYFINGPDVHEAGLDAVEHYAQRGWQEHRRPNPYFDGVWYRQRYAPPDTMSPLCHYVLEGEAQGFRPSLYFDPAWYRDAYGLSPAQSPLRHYLSHRAERGVSPLPLFDIEFYKSRHGADLGRTRDIFAHYLAIGAARDLDPSPWFNAAAYRAAHMTGRPPPPNTPSEALLNPLLHFLATFVLGAIR